MGILTCSMESRSRTVTQWSAGVVSSGLEVQGDAEGGADLVLAAVALADGAGVVVVHHEVLRQLVPQLLGGAGEDLLLAQGQHGALEGGQGRVASTRKARVTRSAPREGSMT